MWDKTMDILGLISGLILPIVIYLYQEFKYDQTFFTYEKQADEYDGLEDQSNFDGRITTLKIININFKNKRVDIEIAKDCTDMVCEVSAEIVQIIYNKRKRFKSLFIKKHIKKLIGKNISIDKIRITNNADKTFYSYKIRDITLRVTDHRSVYF